MLIHLDDSVASRFDRLTTSELNALELIAQAACQGMHLVLVDGDLSRALQNKLGSFSERSSAFFRRQHEGLATSPRQLLKDSPVVIRACIVSSISKETEGHQTIYKCPLSFFDSFTKLLPVTLASEDMYDFNVLVSLARYFRSKCRLQSFRTEFTPAHCGGSGAKRVIQKLLEEKKIFIVITDSDQSLPTEPLGDTARIVSREICRSQHILREHIILKCRELENLVPDCILANILKDLPRSADLILRLSRLNFETLRLYGDFKNGVTMLEIRQYISAAPAKLQNALKRSIVDSHETIDPFCLENEDCKYSSCSCYVLPANGGKACTILKRSVDALEAIQGQELWEGLCDSHLQEIERVLTCVVYWGLAGNPIRA
jgi:hypothetical protein